MSRFALLPVIALPLLLGACEPVPSSDTGAPEAAAPGAVAMPAGLSAEERVIWNSLTPAAQAKAAEFIANGGTLKQFVAV